MTHQRSPSPAARRVPVVVVFAGCDPSGGAGIAADVEAVASMGAHAAPVVTALTVQDTTRATRFEPVDPALVAEQARAVVADLAVAAVKIGMVGSADNAAAIAAVLADLPRVPVVLDPVLAAGGGGSLAGDDAREALRSLLVPHATVVTPNSPEARALAPEADTLDACAQELMALGAEFVLITGTHEPGEHVVNRLYGNRRLLETFTWERLPGSYHGSGCTLASAIAGLLAQGLEPFTAVLEAQEYTWEALRAGYRPGRGQHLPNRLFWAVDREGS